MQKTAREVIASGNVKLVVDFGIELNRRIKAQERELEEIKGFLRQIGVSALAERHTEHSVGFDGSLGVVQVTYPADVPKVRKGVNLLASEVSLPEGVFRLLFVKRTVVDFASSFAEKLRKLAPEDQAVVRELVDVVPTTARVNWPR